jgi:hypothetical protein
MARLLRAYQDALQTAIAHCRQRATTERTPSDFRYADRTTPALPLGSAPIASKTSTAVADATGHALPQRPG